MYSAPPPSLRPHHKGLHLLHPQPEACYPSQRPPRPHTEACYGGMRPSCGLITWPQRPGAIGRGAIGIGLAVKPALFPMLHRGGVNIYVRESNPSTITVGTIPYTRGLGPYLGHEGTSKDVGPGPI
jgi:hypothetical protein